MKKLFGIMLVAVMVSGPIVQAHGGGGGGGYSHGYGGGHYGWGWGLGLGLGLGWCAASYAYPAYYGYPYYYSPTVTYLTPAATTVAQLPAGCQPVVIDGVTYYSINGVTYYQTTAGLCPVAQPPQVVVNNAPPANPAPATYISSTANPSAPVIVAPAQPTVAISPAVNAPVISNAAATQANDSFTINIPNAKGSYTAVTLKRSGTGFTGPQGEYYPEFPKVALLQAVYGK